MLKTLHHLRTEVLEPAPGLLTEILSNLEAAGERVAAAAGKAWWRRSYLQNHLWVNICAMAAVGLALYGDVGAGASTSRLLTITQRA